MTQGEAASLVIGILVAVILGIGVVVPVVQDVVIAAEPSQIDPVAPVVDLIPLFIMLIVIVTVAGPMMRAMTTTSSSRSRDRAAERGRSSGPSEPLRMVLARALGLTQEVTDEDRLERIKEAYVANEIDEREMEERMADLFDLAEEREGDETDEALKGAMREHT